MTTSIADNCGVYAIFLDGNLVYVGSSFDIKKRWNSHLTCLRHNRHTNRHLQHAYTKHGEASLSIRCVESCVTEALAEREQVWLDKLWGNGTLYNHLRQ